MLCNTLVALSVIGASASDTSLDDGLSLLQMRAATQDELEVNDEVNTRSWPLKPKPAFGPDGTWATPWCPTMLGCDPYCPDGCDGTAYWERNPFEPTPRIAAKYGYDPNNKRPHFLTCAQGQSRGKSPNHPDVLKYGGFINCRGSENASKPAYWDEFWTNAELAARKLEHNAFWGEQRGVGNEYCPDDCVDDCASFKLGGFQTCGFGNPGMPWSGYGGGVGNKGPNNNCPLGEIRGAGQQTWTWCPATTTTTTTTPAPTTTTTMMATTEAAQDQASAVGDPHVTSASGSKFDIDH